jgi:hypothetical protein
VGKTTMRYLFRKKLRRNSRGIFNGDRLGGP